MIEFQNVTKYYPLQNKRRYILDDVSFTIPTGSNVGILGMNGAGKSTLLRLIGGAESANQGKITTDSDISWPLGLASGFQGSLTGRQNVKFVCEINGLDKAEIESVMSYVIDFTELGSYFDMPVSTYSSGMRGRLTFGLSMKFKFDVYLIDELTSVGDMQFREKAKAAFDDLSKRASLIFVSHNLKTLTESCQSALFLHEGRAEFFENINEGVETYINYVKAIKGDKLASKLEKQSRIGRKNARLARAKEV